MSDLNQGMRILLMGWDGAGYRSTMDIYDEKGVANLIQGPRSC